MIDPNYVSWLQLHHSESLPEHVLTNLNHDDNMDLDNNLLMDPDMDMDCSAPMTRYIYVHVCTPLIGMLSPLPPLSLSLSHSLGMYRLVY